MAFDLRRRSFQKQKIGAGECFFAYKDSFYSIHPRRMKNSTIAVGTIRQAAIIEYSR